MRRLLVTGIVSVIALCGLLAFAPSAQAEDLTPEQAERVKANCVSIKTSLSQLHASDALLRVNRGQVYESMASKLMEPFNSRLESNDLDGKAMTTVAKNYRSALSTFRTNYIEYEQKLSEALRIDCTTQPNSFHTAVIEARELRNTVHSDVLRLHRLIDDYRSTASDFLLNFERVSQ